MRAKKEIIPNSRTASLFFVSLKRNSSVACLPQKMDEATLFLRTIMDTPLKKKEAAFWWGLKNPPLPNGRLRSSALFFLKRNSPERACICRSGRKCDAIASNTVCLTDKWALLSLIFQDIFTIKKLVFFCLSLFTSEIVGGDAKSLCIEYIVV